jgi:xanthine dehydrogenase YagS FAD-binding subunit
VTPFAYVRAHDQRHAIDQLQAHRASKYLGGGTNLVDLMREDIERPAALVDVTDCSREVVVRNDGTLIVGAGVTNTALAADRRVRENFPVLSRAILSGASAQIRNMATAAGNLLQRTRCTYFYDDAARCNKRVPGAGCDALDGFTRYHAILGASPACVAVHPSDMCVALSVLEANVQVSGRHGTRTIPFLDFHRLPGETPHIETAIEPSELIMALEIPPLPAATRSTYRKVRDRASYAFALVSVAALLRTDAAGNVEDVRVALGGVAHKPWRAHTAEATLRGRLATEALFRGAAEAELAPAKPLRDNSFKIELAKRAIVATLRELLAEARP